MNTTTKTLEQLAEEARIAAEALRTAQEAAAAAERAAKEADAQAKERARREALRADTTEPKNITERRTWLQGIADALVTIVKSYDDLKGHVLITVTAAERKVTENQECGPEVKWKLPSLVIEHRGQRLYTNIEFNAEISGSSYWRNQHTGRTRCSVGFYGERQSFPPRKDGSFNYAAIAAKLMAVIVDAEHKHQTALKLRDNAAPLKDLKAKFNLGEYSRVLEAQRLGGDGRTGTPLWTAAPVGQLYLKLDILVTPAQAEAILDAARAAGVKLS